jgi:hypothetical protein
MQLEHRLRVFENRVLVKTSGLQGKELTGGLNELHYKEFVTDSIAYRLFFGEQDGRGAWHVWGEQKYIQIFGRET